MLNSVVNSGRMLMNMIDWVVEMCCSVIVVSRGKFIIILVVMRISVGRFCCLGCVLWSVKSSRLLISVVIIVWVEVRNIGEKFLMVMCVVGSDLLKIIMLIRLLFYFVKFFCIINVFFCWMFLISLVIWG